MKLSTRSRYGMRAMVDIARHQDEGLVSVKEMAERQGVSEKYMEHIIARLRVADLVSSRRGAHGGYTLSRSADEITAQEVVHVLEGTPFLLECVRDPSVCDRADSCTTIGLWARVEDAMNSVLASVTLSDLAARDRSAGNGVACPPGR